MTKNQPQRRGTRSRRQGSKRNRKGPSESYSRPGPLTINSTVNIPFPARVTTRLKYADQITLNPGAGSMASYVFRANSLFDPDFTSTGHQPYGYDQMAQLYNHYTVNRAIIQATLLNNTSVYPIWLGVALHDDQYFVPTSITNALEIPYQKSVMCPGTANGGGARSVQQMFDARKFFGVAPALLTGTTDYGAAVGANPTEGAYFIVFVGGLGVEDPSALNITVQIVFEATFNEPNTQGSS